jgi:hypothetical protein
LAMASRVRVTGYGTTHTPQLQFSHRCRLDGTV